MNTYYIRINDKNEITHCYFEQQFEDLICVKTEIDLMDKMSECFYQDEKITIFETENDTIKTESV